MTVHNREHSVGFSGITSMHKDKKMYLSPRFILKFCEFCSYMAKETFILLGESGLVQGPDV